MTLRVNNQESLSSIHSNMQAIKEFAFTYLHASDESELLSDEWITFNDNIDLNIHDMEGVISIQAYPVIDDKTVTKDMIHVAALPTYDLYFDALEYFGRSDESEFTPKEIAFTNIMEHIAKEVEHFKSLSTATDLVIASELYTHYLNLFETSKKS